MHFNLATILLPLWRIHIPNEIEPLVATLFKRWHGYDEVSITVGYLLVHETDWMLLHHVLKGGIQGKMSK